MIPASANNAQIVLGKQKSDPPTGSRRPRTLMFMPQSISQERIAAVASCNLFMPKWHLQRLLVLQHRLPKLQHWLLVQDHAPLGLGLVQAAGSQ
mmetsp:Transcript_67046/g.129646  ORF Transcript_67046/g.129646 Transcript_67046/m.129646 type:complete len:94 (-) Transcript_67046:465-746(-)